MTIRPYQKCEMGCDAGMWIPARELFPGAEVNLEKDEYANRPSYPADSPEDTVWADFYAERYAVVDDVQMQPGCVVVHFADTPSVCFPLDHCVRVATYGPSYGRRAFNRRTVIGNGCRIVQTTQDWTPGKLAERERKEAEA